MNTKTQRWIVAIFVIIAAAIAIYEISTKQGLFH